MRAKPIGRVLAPDMFLPWMTSHAAYPTPFQLDEKMIRVFFVSRDSERRGHVGWCDVSASDPTRVVGLSPKPVFGPGEPGAFDDSGVAIGNVVPRDDGLYLYYMGWNRSVTVPFRNAIGLAVSRDGRGERFERLFTGPILDRSRYDPFTLSYPFVRRHGDGWEMVYGTHHSPTYDPMHHVFSVAVSNDGIDWSPTGQELLCPRPDEAALTRPWIFSRDDTGEQALLFTSCGTRYSIVGATRDADNIWRRQQDPVIAPTREAWSDTDVCFASRIVLESGDYVFFNGNQYGMTGFGVAVLAEHP